MKRFIRYLYEYEQGKRKRNVGFVKVEQEEGECILHIHGKGLRIEAGSSFQVYLFYAEGEKCIGVLQGEIGYMGPALNYRLRYTKEDVGVPQNYEKVNGVLLEGSGNHRFAALWDEAFVDIEKMQIWQGEKSNVAQDGNIVEQENPSRPESMLQKEGKNADADIESAKYPQDEIEEQRENVPDTSSEAPSFEQPMIQAPAEADEVSCNEMCGEVSAPEMAAYDTENTDSIVNAGDMNRTNSIGTPVWKVTKLQRKDITMLPRCEWRLANNNFLLHGYYNYRHLVLLDNGTVLKLGVPGIYHEKEARAAEGFGFPEFINAEETKLSLKPEECNKEELFGYWCRQVRRRTNAR